MKSSERNEEEKEKEREGRGRRRAIYEEGYQCGIRRKERNIKRERMSNRRRERSIDPRGWKSSKGANEVVSGGEGGELSKGKGRKDDASLRSLSFRGRDVSHRRRFPMGSIIKGHPRQNYRPADQPFVSE